MNYLSHYHFNHRVLELKRDPDFVLGVVLPDLWSRFSRKRRLRWRAIRGAAPADAPTQALRAGLLNHVEVDRWFHSTPTFLRWQSELKRAADTDGLHPALAEFLVHIGIELVMDHHLLRDCPTLADEFYDVLAVCDPQLVAERVGGIGAVDTAGLDQVIAEFVRRRFLRCYHALENLEHVIQLVLDHAGIPAPPKTQLGTLLAQADPLVNSDEIWRELAVAADGLTQIGGSPAPSSNY